MKPLNANRFPPSPSQVKMASGADDSLSQMGVDQSAEFFALPHPSVTGYERGELGCLIRQRGCGYPHKDAWIGSLGFYQPRKQRSIFWLLAGDVIFKTEGCESVPMSGGGVCDF